MTGALQRIWDQTLQPLARRAGFDVRRYRRPIAAELRALDAPGMAFSHLISLRHEIEQLPPTPAADFLRFAVAHAPESHSQLFQDLFVWWVSGGMSPGYFVEFGAADGVHLSNTKLLEERLGWTGIVAEPARIWHERLRANRQCIVDTRCVWSVSEQRLDFIETPIGELSTLSALSGNDRHAASRTAGVHYPVETISLNDLLAAHSAPPHIDYLSIDTEGSELDILEAFDFSKHSFGVISVEHNRTPAREEIHSLLSAEGYERRFEAFSRFDDWYSGSKLVASTTPLHSVPR